MRCDTGILEEYMILAQRIGDSLAPHLSPQPKEHLEGWLLALYNAKGLQQEKGAKWTRYNIRGGAKSVVPGTLAELIASIVVRDNTNISSDGLGICEDQNRQLNGIDINNDIGETIQVKTFITFKNTDRVYQCWELEQLATEFMALVDVDSNRCYIIESEKLLHHVSSKPLFDQPGKDSSYGWTCNTEEMEQLAINSNCDTSHLYKRNKPVFIHEAKQLKHLLN